MYSYDFKVYSHNVFNGLILSLTGRGKGNERKIRKKKYVFMDVEDRMVEIPIVCI